jgi:hypothetical protein
MAPMPPLVRAARRRLLSGKRGEDVTAKQPTRQSRVAKIRVLAGNLLRRHAREPHAEHLAEPPDAAPEKCTA